MKSTSIILMVITLTWAAPKASKLKFRNLYKETIVPITNHPRIIGGQEAVPHSIPYQVFLEIYNMTDGWYCGGSLLTPNYIVTAAHCGVDARQAYIILGAHKALAAEDTQIQAASSKIILHEDYIPEEIGNDIAVIALPETITLTDAIGTINVPSPNSGDFAGQIARASGWGLIDGHGHTISDVLNYVDIEVITNNECEEIFGLLDDSILCTSGSSNTSTCNGDSGGPLVIDGSLIGITSFGVQYCPGGYPAAFTRVTTFLDWLAVNTDIETWR